MKINNVAMVGFGAIGCVYARRIVKSLGENFAVVAGGKRAQRIRNYGETVNGEKIMPRVVEPEDTQFKADLVIFTVKNYQLEQAIKDIRNIVSEKTILLTILNGVSARDTIKSAYPENTVLYGLCKTDSARTEKGIECSWEGQIQFGEADNSVMSDEVRAVKDIFDNAEIKNEVCEDMMRAMWFKFMINVSINQLSAVTRAGYGAFIKVPELNRAMREVMTEVITLAQKKGINITEADADKHEKSMVNSDPEGKTSMLQDIEAKRQTEAEYFAGTVIRLGREAGVPTPWNDRIYLLIRTIESLY
ncbi:ketopantoate reductase family protein [Lachnospiraceae bacterium NSJ-143]|nr:ketopantoate reductase family protein [Lachnospiraceae bacterium NSJ-143]